MTDDEMRNSLHCPVVVRAADYSYDGVIVSVFYKRNKEKTIWRCVVEDDRGRCFIHNSSQLEVPGNGPKLFPTG